MTAGLPSLLPQMFTSDAALYPIIRSVAPQVLPTAQYRRTYRQEERVGREILGLNFTPCCAAKDAAQSKSGLLLGILRV